VQTSKGGVGCSGGWTEECVDRWMDNRYIVFMHTIDPRKQGVGQVSSSHEENANTEQVRNMSFERNTQME
jgi:hypothetical protein